MDNEMHQLIALCGAHTNTFSGDCVDCHFRRVLVVEHLVGLIDKATEALRGS